MKTELQTKELEQKINTIDEMIALAKRDIQKEDGRWAFWFGLIWTINQLGLYIAEKYKAGLWIDLPSIIFFIGGMTILLIKQQKWKKEKPKRVMTYIDTIKNKFLVVMGMAAVAFVYVISINYFLSPGHIIANGSIKPLIIPVAAIFLGIIQGFFGCLTDSKPLMFSGVFLGLIAGGLSYGFSQGYIHNSRLAFIIVYFFGFVVPGFIAIITSRTSFHEKSQAP